MPLLLNIDTATENASVSLTNNGIVLAFAESTEQKNHASFVQIAIEKIIADTQITFNQINAIAVTNGPGSYTGLRVGVVIAKMFGWNNNIPVFTVSSLGMMASNKNENGLYLAEIDARRGNSFLGLYKVEEGIISLQDNEQLTNLEEYKSDIKEEFEVVNEGIPDMKKIIQLLACCFVFVLAACNNGSTEASSNYHDTTGRTDILSGGVQRIPIHTDKGDFTVWTKRVGNNPTKKVLLLHGGPGATHEYFECSFWNWY